MRFHQMPEAGPELITVDVAFQRLRSQRPVSGEPYAVCEQMNADIRARRIRLFVDGVEVQPNFFARHLRVAYDDKLGVAEIVAIAALTSNPAQSTWTVASKDIEALIAAGREAKAERRRGGGRPSYNWDAVYAVTLSVLRDEGWPEPRSFRDFAEKVCDACVVAGWPDGSIPDPDTVREKLSIWLGGPTLPRA